MGKKVTLLVLLKVHEIYAGKYLAFLKILNLIVVIATVVAGNELHILLYTANARRTLKCVRHTCDISYSRYINV